MKVASTPLLPGKPRDAEVERRYVTGRRRLKRLSNCLFVKGRDFVRLAISRQSLERADELEAGVRGLYDLASGLRYFIEQEALENEEASDLVHPVVPSP